MFRLSLDKHVHLHVIHSHVINTRGVVLSLHCHSFVPMVIRIELVVLSGITRQMQLHGPLYYVG